MSKPQESLVESTILQWARKTIGLTIDEVAGKINKEPETIREWESGKSKPTISTLKKLSALYKRSLAVFFMPAPPKEPSMPPDLRTLPLNERRDFSKDTILGIRKARRVQNLYAEIAENLGRNIPQLIPKGDINKDPEQLVMKVRNILNAPIEKQFKLKDDNSAFEYWKDIVENSGVLVLRLTMPLNEARGFSINGQPPIIVLNNKDARNANIFSLFHEYAHLMLNKGGICDFQDKYYPTKETKVIETYCNGFAGEFLVPKEVFMAEDIVSNIQSDEDLDDEKLYNLSRKYSVSQAVILVRLYNLRKITKKLLEEKLKYVLRSKKKDGFGRNYPHKTCVRENSKPLVSLVLEAYNQKLINLSNVSGYLDLRLRYFPQVQALIEGRPQS